jgi:ABC-2 type transport system permease protein
MRTLLSDEILKLRTVRSPWALFAAAQAVIVLGGAGRLARGDGTPADAVGAAGHVGLISLFSLVLGIFAVAGEYRNQTITGTYLGTPQRSRVVGAKLGVYSAVGLGFGLAGAAIALVLSAVWLSADGTGMDWSQPELWRTLIGGVIWNALFAAIGVGLGAVVRNLTAALAAGLAWLALVEGLVGQLIGSSASKWLPFAAGTALDRVPAAVADGLPQWGAGLVLVGYAGIASALALTVGVRRDVV